MSVYSIDSLEDTNEVSPRKENSLQENHESNLESSDPSFYSKPIIPTLNRKEDTRSNETTLRTGTDKAMKTAGSRNAIIANRELVDASKRRHPASSSNGKRDVSDHLKRITIDNAKQEETNINKRVAIRCSKRFPKVFSTKRSSCPKESPLPMKPDKKLGNVLASKLQPARKPCSYLELYRRRFDGPQCNIPSPEGFTLSVCGDSKREQLSDDDIRSLATPRDDQSELSFYRRIIEGSTNALVSAARSTEAVRRRTLQDTNTNSFSSNRSKEDASGDKSKTSLGYRPYTIEEYKTLSIPKLDRSLGPDKVEMQAKREWLMRRRSYGNSASARNRLRILQQAHKLKSNDAIAEKCFLPLLKDQKVDAKSQDDSTSLNISEDQEKVQKSSGRYLKKKRVVYKMLSSRKSKKFERTSSFCSSLNSHDFIEDSYLDSLRQRHLHEKQMVDRIVHQALFDKQHRT